MGFYIDRNRKSVTRVLIGLFMVIASLALIRQSNRAIVTLILGLAEMVRGYPRKKSSGRPADTRIHNLRGEAETLTVYPDRIEIRDREQEGRVIIPIPAVHDSSVIGNYIQIQHEADGAVRFSSVKIADEKIPLAQNICKTITLLKAKCQH